MPSLSTTINGTHGNTIQISATFNTKVKRNPLKLVVTITLIREGNKIGIDTDYVMDLTNRTREVNYTEHSVTLKGELTLNRRAKSIGFTGFMVLPGQVQVGMSPVIVAEF